MRGTTAGTFRRCRSKPSGEAVVNAVIHRDYAITGSQVLKTLIQLENGGSPHHHNLPRLCDELDGLAAQAGARHGRVYLAAEASLRESSVLNDWKPEQRYRGPGVTANDARAWYQEADVAYRRIIGQLSLAGVI